MDINFVNNSQSFTAKRIPLSTNGVLRCMSGEVFSPKKFGTTLTEADMNNANDVWNTVKKVFDCKDALLDEMKANNDPLGAFLYVISAGKFLIKNNPGLEKIYRKLESAKMQNTLDRTVKDMVEDLGENITLTI